MLSRGDTGDRLAEVDEVLGCLVVQTIEHHEVEATACLENLERLGNLTHQLPVYLFFVRPLTPVLCDTTYLA